LVGGDGADSLRGDNGDDTLYGNDGNDILEGGNGADSLSGGEGADQIEGGAGADVLSGGAGADLFVWRNSNDSASNSDRDVVHDFTPGEDRLDFSDLQDDLVFVTTPTGQVGQVWFDDRSNWVSIDLTGSGGADVSIHLIGVTDLNEGDFLF
uniref:M10 family metallopeptidase C-terminal domain-containing protein n=1 Tax=uncultured Pelagimonas sp. TaxID=1618102 RepID=UPI002610393F